MLAVRYTLSNILFAGKRGDHWLSERISEFRESLRQSKAEIKPLGENSCSIVPENYMTSECRESIKKFGVNADELGMLILSTLAYKSLGCRKKQSKHGDSFERTWFPLSSRIWKNAYWNYKNVVVLLIIHGFLEQDGVGIKGVTCKKYRLGKACFKEYVKNEKFYEQIQEWAKTLDENGNSAVAEPQMFIRNKDFKGEKNFATVKFTHPKIIERINESRRKIAELPNVHRIQERFLNGSDSQGRKYVTLSDEILKEAEDEFQDELKKISKLRKKSKIAKRLEQAECKRWQIGYLHEQINSGHAYYVVDGTSQRAHHPCTILPSKYMKHLRFCGEKIAESDYRNSQPAIFAYVMDMILSGNKEFIRDFENLMFKAACVGKTRPIIGNEIRRFRRSDLLKRYPNHEALRNAIRTAVTNFIVYVRQNEQGVRKYIADCYAGKTYGKVQIELNKIGSKENPKKITFKNMFGHTRECTIAQIAAKRAYPEAMAAIDLLKEMDYGITAKIAQAIESNEMFQKVLLKIQETNPFVLTRHDSVIALPSMIRECRKQMDQAFEGRLETKLSYQSLSETESREWQRVESSRREEAREASQPVPPTVIYVAAEKQENAKESSQVHTKSHGTTKHRLSHWLIP
jgi:predicted Zn-ribbon and HTH transcriptional regulator